MRMHMHVHVQSANEEWSTASWNWTLAGIGFWSKQLDHVTNEHCQFTWKGCVGCMVNFLGLYVEISPGTTVLKAPGGTRSTCPDIPNKISKWGWLPLIPCLFFGCFNGLSCRFLDAVGGNHFLEAMLLRARYVNKWPNLGESMFFTGPFLVRLAMPRCWTICKSL